MLLRYTLRNGLTRLRVTPLYSKTKRFQSTQILQQSKAIEKDFDLNRFKSDQLDGAVKLTNQSSENIVIDEAKLIDEIPEPPVPFTNQEFDTINLALRNTIEFFQLNTYWPPGLVRTGLQAIHEYTALPWWEVIAIGVLLGRLCLFPVTLMNLRNAARFQQFQPEMSRLTKNLSDAQKSGDQFQTQFAMVQLANFQKKNKLNPLGSFKTMIPQMAYFMSFFVAIKRMAAAPIESFKTEGFWIFSNLTVTDPTWILSTVCATTLHCVLRLGVEMPQLPGSMGPLMKTGMLYGFPAIVLISTHFFPSALLVYWCTSNFISLFFAALFRIPSLRKACNLPPLKKQAKNELQLDGDGKPVKNNLFTRLKDAYYSFTTPKAPVDSKLAKNDDLTFRKAGKGPVPPTYSYNPRERFPEAFKESKPVWKFWNKN